jgi:hypothetical protein
MKNDGLEFVLVWQGAVLAMVGGVRLVRFLRSHPRLAETAA